MTLDQLITDVNSKLTRVGSNRIDAPDILTSVLNVIAFFATQISSIIPLWTDILTFQTDGSDAGRFCRYADTNGKVRLFETKVDDNINNPPPTNPLTTENAFWEEVSASVSAAIPEWAAGVYGPGIVIVYHNHSTDGKGLYILTEPVRPFSSINIETEITAGDWERLTANTASRPAFADWDLSTDTMPVNADAIGSGAAGAILRGDEVYFIVAGNANGEARPAGTSARALQNSPTLDSHWRYYG